jgi:hypothetical protein
MKRFGLLLVALLLIAAAPAYSQGCSGLPNANTLCAGATSGGAAFPSFRAMVSGDIGSGTIQTGNIGSGAVAYGNIQNVAASRLLGNPTGSPASVSEISLGASLAFSGTALQTGAGTGDVTWSANSFATTLAWISRVSGKTLTLNNTLTLAGVDGKTETFNNSLTFAGVDGKTETFNNSITWAGTDATTMTFPSSSAHVAALDLPDQTVTGGGLVTPNAQAAGNFTLDCGKVPLQWIPNTGAFTITAPALTGTNSQNCALRVINGTTASNAGAVTLAGFSGKSPGGATFATTATVSAASVSYTNGSANIGWTANGLSLGSVVFLATTGALPTNFSTSTHYYVVTTGTNTIQVSATPGGAAITAGSAGSGTQTAYVPSIYDLIVLGIDGPVYAQWNQIQ